MKKILLLITLLFAGTELFSQTGIYRDRFYISGTLALGMESRSFADSSAWLQLGNDTTGKGMIIPRVLLDSIRTTKRGVFVYDLKDSVLYHFDSNRRVRYMTYKDTVLIKSLVAGYYKQNGNAFAQTAVLGTADNYGLNIKTNDTDRIYIKPTGEVGIGIAPTNGMLQVNGMLSGNGLNLINNAAPSAYSCIRKDMNYGQVQVGANGLLVDYLLVNNPTNGFSVFEVPHATNDANFYGKLSVRKNSSEVQVDISGSPSGHLFSGISTGAFGGSNKGFIAFGDAYSSANTALVFSSGKLSVANGNLLVNTYTDNGHALNINGDIYTNATITTGQPSVNGAGVIKIGKVITGTSVTLKTDKYLEIEVDGVIYKLAIVN